MIVFIGKMRVIISQKNIRMKILISIIINALILYIITYLLGPNPIK